MKVKLINEPNLDLSATEQVLINRGIQFNAVSSYINTTDENINPPEALIESRLHDAARLLISTIKNNSKVLIIVDSDCDGFTSAAVLINYLYDIFPAFVINNVT